jgi:hypothetical protein
MSFHRCAKLALLIGLGFLAGCPQDGVNGADDSGDDTGGDGGPGGPDADVGDTPCDMSGVWVAEQHTVSIALGADQFTTAFYYYSIEQTGDRFTIVDALNCAFVVDGTTTVSVSDETLTALARQEIAGPNRQGNYVQNGDQCEFSLDRSYNLRGADKAMYLTDHWQVGDPPMDLADFPALPTAPPGMEDWDGDAMDGITLVTGIGDRYVAQRDWNQHLGTTPTFAAVFGGEGVITVQWDAQEGISEQTSPLLRTTATPSGDGWARYARAPQLEVVAGDDLQTCRNVQQLAQQIWP